MKLRVGLISQWPEIKNAEYELLEKIRRTKGYDFYLIDYFGYDIITGALLSYKDLDFAIAFHYETPKFVNCFTYCAIVNPVEYVLSSHAYASHAAINYMTHDAHVMAKASTFLRYYLNNILGRDINYSLYPEFYLSVSRNDCCSPCVNFSHLFYCGINWERLKDAGGRFGDMFAELDDKKIMQIYGPVVFEGKKPWAGFESYKGEIPFDGVSIINTINQCGVSLVLSSEAHIANEIATCRIYESCAAGAVIIADDNPFVVREFGDSVLYFKKTGIAIEDAKQIKKHFQWIQNNPKKAAELAEKSQRIFLEKFSLEFVMGQIAHDYHKRREELVEGHKLSPLVTIVLRVLYKTTSDCLEEAINSIISQDYTNFEIIVQCPSKLSIIIQERLKKRGGASIPVVIQEIEDFDKKNRQFRKGKYFVDAVNYMSGEYLALIEPGWKWNYDHLSVMVNGISDSDLIMSGCYQSLDAPAPIDSRTVKNFCDELLISDFEKQRLFVDLPAFLISRRLIQKTSYLNLFFEHYEALLLFIEANLGETKPMYTKKITVARLSESKLRLLQKMSVEKKSNLGFWGKVESKFDNPDYELKIIYDRIRFCSNLGSDIKNWLAIKAESQHVYIQAKIKPFTLKDLTNILKERSYKEFCFAYLLYKVFKIMAYIFWPALYLWRRLTNNM